MDWRSEIEQLLADRGYDPTLGAPAVLTQFEAHMHNRGKANQPLTCRCGINMDSRSNWERRQKH